MAYALTCIATTPSNTERPIKNVGTIGIAESAINNNNQIKLDIGGAISAGKNTAFHAHVK